MRARSTRRWRTRSCRAFTNNRGADQEIPCRLGSPHEGLPCNITPRFGAGAWWQIICRRVLSARSSIVAGHIGKDFEAARQKTVWDSGVNESWDAFAL